MKSLDELIEEIRREALGEPPAPSPGPEAGARPPDPGREPPPPERSSEPSGAPPVSEQDFDIRLDVDLGVAPGPTESATEEEEDDLTGLVGPSTTGRPVPRPPGETTPPEPVDAGRVRKVRRRRLARGARRGLAAALVGLLVGGAVVTLTLLRDGGEDAETPPASVGPLPEQDVVTWAVWDPEVPDLAFVTVITGGGDLDPIALGIPAYTVVNIPGYGLATVGDAAALRDPALVAGSVENLLGVGVDAWEVSTLEGLAGVVDRLGGIEVDGRAMAGQDVVRHLTRGDDDPAGMELRFLRWQQVTSGVLRAAAGKSGELAEVFPSEIAAVVAAAGSGGADVLELPVTDIGSGLARPDPDAVQALVVERFVPTATTGRVVRLVVENGVGMPGIGERVGRVLVPAGFRLVSSGNAATFGLQETEIIAASEEFLEEAELARRLLGVGRVYLGEQPTGVWDVTVRVGRDFAGQ